MDVVEAGSIIQGDKSDFTERTVVTDKTTECPLASIDRSKLILFGISEEIFYCKFFFEIHNCYFPSFSNFLFGSVVNVLSVVSPLSIL